jgi:P4 family phage/plasmid primase-like protien
MSTTPISPEMWQNGALHATEMVRLLSGDDGVVELRAVNVRQQYGSPKTMSGFFDVRAIGQDPQNNPFTQAVVALAPCAENVYVTINPVHRDLLARRWNRIAVAEQNSSASDADIVARRWLLIDIDPVRRPKISATDGEKLAAKELVDRVAAYLAERGWPQPMLVDSGNGVHIYYRVDLPCDDGGLVKACLAALADRFDSDAAKVDLEVANPSRVAKLAGTMARKGDWIDERPHRWASVLSRPPEFAIVPRELLDALAAEAPQPVQRVANRASTGIPSRRHRDVSSISERARRYVAMMDVAIEGQGGSNKAFHVACSLVQGFGLTIDDALPLMAEWNVRCLPPWSDAELLHKLRDADAVNEPRGRGYLLGGAREASGSHGVAGDRALGTDDELQAEPGDDLCPNSPENRTDLANARRFCRLHGNNFRYVALWKKWLEWDGTRWRLDELLAVQQAFRDVTAELLARALESRDNEAMRFARSTAKIRDFNAAILLAQSESGIPLSPSCLDQEPWLLNCTNGTVDLRTGELRAQRRDDFLTAVAPIAFNRNATSVAWNRFLESTFGGSRHMIEFIRRWFGYCLTGVVSEQRLPVFWGAGANGKSTLLNAVQDVLGRDYATAGARDLLLAKRGDSHPTELADLFGKRLIVCAEADEGRALAEGQLKQLTGGDRIKARRMREDFWEFSPTHKMVLVTNALPRVRGDDHAIWRRLLLVPFGQKFWNPDGGETGPEELRQDKDLQAKLRAEREGILAWLVHGCLEWQRIGLSPPPEVQAATQDYQSREDRIGAFLEECCTVSPTHRVRAGVLFEVYKAWCDRLAETPYTGTRFGSIMSERFKKERSGGRWYLGIGLREAMRNDDNC